MVAVVVAINPAEYLRKSRDAKRVTDITSIDKSIGILEALSAIPSYGTANTVYVSLPDTSSTCANLGLPTLPTGYSYNCVTSANLKNTDGTGWIPLDFNSSGVVQLSTLPIDPTNSTSTGLYYTYIGGSYELTATFETTKYQTTVAQIDGGASDNALEKGTNLSLTPMVFPHNWVKVPGNSTLGTSDFWVMKYEAKYDKDGNGDGDDALTCRQSSSYDTWYYGGAGTDCPSSWDNTKVVSTANGSPIASISHT